MSSLLFESVTDQVPDVVIPFPAAVSTLFDAKVNKEEKAIFNATVKTIISQGDNISDVSTLTWIKEIGKAANAINVVWAVVEEEKSIETSAINLPILMRNAAL